MKPIFLLLVLELVGCSSMHTQSPCSAAKDRCVSFEEADDLTRFADSPNTFIQRKRKSIPIQRGAYLSEVRPAKPIWIAPWKDKKGRAHAAMKVYPQSKMAG